MKKINIVTSLLLCSLLASAIAAQNNNNLTWQPTLDGFEATYNDGATRLFVEQTGVGTGTTISRIKDSKNNIIVESLRTSGALTLRVVDVVVTLNLDLKTPELSTASKLTEQDEARLIAFRISRPAASVRKVIA